MKLRLIIPSILFAFSARVTVCVRVHVCVCVCVLKTEGILNLGFA